MSKVVKKFKKILIANRGEIALRVIRTCREMRIPTVAVYSEADRDSLHVKLADEAYCIGPAASKESYLNPQAILSAAEVSGADAIHPGYGFLSENAAFNEMCRSHDITFIGPSPEAVRKMGDKAEAKKTMREAKVPVVPGSKDILTEDMAAAEKLANDMGYPVIVKASAGGGGRGMRVIQNKFELATLIQTAKQEALAAFSNGDVYLEKYISEPRHVEIQIMADRYGNVVYLGERDCSIQRRHQKLIEEAPCPAVDEKLRQKLGDAAIRAAKAVHYEGAGTIEFLLDNKGEFYFMEMNTRLQVEHCVTEMVTSFDLVKLQILVAMGEQLSIKQKDVIIRGHAIEFRINAEDPRKDFMPSPGTLTLWHPPGGFGVRVDSHAYAGYRIPPNYDSMIGKLIVWGPTRDEAIARGKRALDEFAVDGVKTVIPLHILILNNAFYRSGKFDTNFIPRRINMADLDA